MLKIIDFFQKTKKQKIGELDVTATPIRKAQTFTEAAAEFEVFRRDLIIKSEKKAWIVAGIMSVIAFGSSVAFWSVFTAHKEPDPIFIKVDNNTGFTNVMKTLNQSQADFDETIKKYWLNKYVIARENYDWFLIQKDFDAVSLMSNASVGATYKKMALSKDAPVEEFKDQFKLLIKVTNITFIQGAAQVRFERTKVSSDGTSTEPPTKWIATIAFSFENIPMTDAQRTINPVGFIVNSYRLDSESL
jgi:type IV secretion system protein VirB8